MLRLRSATVKYIFRVTVTRKWYAERSRSTVTERSRSVSFRYANYCKTLLYNHIHNQLIEYPNQGTLVNSN